MITENVVLSAAHCANNRTDTKKFPFIIGLGLHNVSNLITLTDRTSLDKTSLKQVKDVIIHPEYNGEILLFDFVLFVLESPVKLSKIISPVCLPLPEELELENKENILTGFGAHKIWYIEYERLLGKPMNRASLIPEELLSNESALMATITDYDFQKNAVERFYNTFYEMFPGIEKCIENFEFVCKITNKTMDSITENIKLKLAESGIPMEKIDVNSFLG